MKIRSTSMAMAAMMSATFLAAPINVLAKAPDMVQAVYAQPFADGEQAAAKEKHYDLDWELKKADSPGDKSMAADYIEKVTTVKKDGKWTFTISIKPASSQYITKFYYYKDGTRLEAQQNGNDWSFTLDKKPEKTIKIAFTIPIMGKEPDALLNILEYNEIKGEASQEPNTPDPSKPNTGDTTPEQKPKEETGLEKAKKALEKAIQKANGIDRAQWEGSVIYALNNAVNYGEVYLTQPTATVEGSLLKEAQINYLLALGEKSKGIKLDNLREGQISVADYSVQSNFDDIEQYIEKKEITKEKDQYYCIVTFKPVVKGNKTTYVENFQLRGDENLLETVTVGDKVYPKKIKVSSHSVSAVTIDGVNGKVSFAGREGLLSPNGKKALDYSKLWNNCQKLTAGDSSYLDEREIQARSDVLNEGIRLLQTDDLTQGALDRFDIRVSVLTNNGEKATSEDIRDLKATIERAKQRDLSRYTDESKSQFYDLLERAMADANRGEISKSRVAGWNRVIDNWHGEIKNKKPKEDKKDKPKEDKKDDKKDEKKKKQTVRYDVPVELVKSDGSKSMASSALSSWATVDEYDGHYTYYVQFKPMKLGEKDGHLTNLFYYENGRKYQAHYHGGDLWSFTLDEKVSNQKIAVWVDIMDEMAGGTGKGEQEAYIQFNWRRAQETKRFDGEVKEPEKKKEDEKKKDEKKKADEKALEQKKKDFLKAQKERERDVVLRTFHDVSAGYWAVDAIAHSYARGYFKGEGEGRFAPERAITRGEFVSILGRMAGASTSNTATAFGDVPSGAYYAGYVAWAQSKGIVAGVSQGRFEPNRTITREEMAVMLMKFLASQNKSYAATSYGNFSDGSSIAGWAKDSVDKMTRQGILSGMGNGDFAPKANFSRAQAAQVLYTIDTKDMK